MNPGRMPRTTRKISAPGRDQWIAVSPVKTMGFWKALSSIHTCVAKGLEFPKDVVPQFSPGTDRSWTRSPSHHLEQNPSCYIDGCNSDAETGKQRVNEAAESHNYQKRPPLSQVILPQHSIATSITMSKRMMNGGRTPQQTKGRQRTIPKNAVARSSSSWMNMVLVLTKTDHAWAGGGRRLASYLIGSPNTTHQKVSLPSGVQATPIPISL